MSGLGQSCYRMRGCVYVSWFDIWGFMYLILCASYTVHTSTLDYPPGLSVVLLPVGL